MSESNPLKIFLPKRLSETGGTSTFARNLKKGLEEQGHSVTFTYQPDYDLLLASPTAPLRYLIHAKLKRRPIVHRLDGTYYPGSSAGLLWWLLNLQLTIIRNYFADSIIYQSQFSLNTCDQYLGGPTSKPHTIIYNGVDTKKFSPNANKMSLKDNPDQTVLITASRFRTEDQIVPLLATFSNYHRHFKKNSKLIIIGPFQERVSHIPKQYQGEPGVTFLGTVKNRELPDYLRSADIFIMTHKTPPCPNNVLEALASGLPICGVADGAMPELVISSKEGELIPEPTPDQPFPVQSLAERINTITQNQIAYARHARQRAEEHLSLKKMITAYALLLQDIAQSKTPK